MLRDLENIEQRTLEELGLNGKEAKVYLACLELGSDSVLNIAKKAGIKRPSTYIILDSLAKKGLVAKIPDKKAILYSAEDPQKILINLDQKRQNLKDVLPLLRAIHNKEAGKPQIRFYEGKDEMKKVYEEDIYLAKAIFFYGTSIKDFIEQFSNTFEKGEKLFKKNKTKVREIVDSSIFAQHYAKKYARSPLREIKVLPESFEFYADNIIWKNKIAIVSLEKLFMVVIESKDIANTYRTIFELIWKSLRP